jgi:hypothetical protein
MAPIEAPAPLPVAATPADVAPDARKLLDDIRSMSVAHTDRERLVNQYLAVLIRAVEASESTQGGSESASLKKTIAERE